MVKKVLVELDINGILYASSRVEESKLNETIFFYRQIGTIRSEGGTWEIFIYKKSYKYRRLLRGAVKKDWESYIFKKPLKTI